MSNNIMWGYLIHLGFNFWQEYRETPDRYGDMTDKSAGKELICDKNTWDETTGLLAARGGNMLVIDLGEGVKYNSHPELAVKGSWEPETLRAEIERLRSMGITPIPKMNFSTSHDEWLGPYSRMVSTPTYYQVCRDLLEEVIEIFDNPPLFHLGMDEETYGHQALYAYAAVRNGDLWWQDLYRSIDILEKHNVRPWVWSDYIWSHPEIFVKKMPKTVLQSNWYYDVFFDAKSGSPDEAIVRAYDLLDKHGYDQIPTGGLWSRADSMEQTVRYCKNVVASDRLKGFLQTSWKATTPKFRYLHLAAVDLLGTARESFDQQ